MTTRAFSNSELRTFKDCPRKWWLGTYRRLRPAREAVAGTAASLGDRVHKALAGYYVPEGQERQDPLAVLDQQVADELQAYPELEKDILSDAELAKAMLQGYLEWLEEEGEDSNIEVIAPETELVVEVGEVRPGGPIVVLVAKLDVRVRRVSDGLVFFMDHKTVGSLKEPLKTLPMDEQMKHYLMIERIHARQTGSGDVTAGGLYNMLRKVKRTALAKPPFYGREFITHNDTTLRNFWSRVMGTIDNILDAEERLDAGEDHHFVVPPNPTRDCTWKCEFFAVCTMFDDGSDAEGVLASAFEEGDPYARYTTTEMRS